MAVREARGGMIYFIGHWLDSIWLLCAIIAVEGWQRKLKALGFVATCMIALRLQVAFVTSMGYVDGLLPLIALNPFHRGVIAYSIVIMINFILVHYFPATRGVFYISLSLGLFFAGFALCSVMMLL